jgi:hypothetical protein
MSRFYRGQCIQPVVLWVALLLFFSLSKPVIGSPQGLVRSGSVKVEGKTSDSIIAAERHFIVTESTTILDVNGKKIQLTNLPIPCKAEIEYRLRMDQDPVTLKIIVKRVLPGSSTMWSTSASE